MSRVLPDLFFAGIRPKPILRAQTDSVVSELTTVTFLCEGTMGAQEYRLYKNGHFRNKKYPPNPKNKAEFSISKIVPQEAGQYTCQYWTHYGWSEHSDALELVVTGEKTHKVHSLRFVCQEVVLYTGVTLHTALEGKRAFEGI